MPKIDFFSKNNLKIPKWKSLPTYTPGLGWKNKIHQFHLCFICSFNLFPILIKNPIISEFISQKGEYPTYVYGPLFQAKFSLVMCTNAK